MNTKTTDLWLSRDPDGSHWFSADEPDKATDGRGTWWWQAHDSARTVPFDVPIIRKGTKRPIRVTVEVLR